MPEIKCPGDFRIFQSALAVRLQKKQLPKAQQKPLYIMLAMPSAYIIILPMTMIWFFNSWNYLFYLNYIVYLKHILTGDTRQYLSPRSPCFGFFVCPCYSRSIQYLMLQDPQNIAACENQGIQHELSNHWKSVIKHYCFKKKIRGNGAKKTKILTPIQVLTKDFTSYTIMYRFLRKRK